MCKAIAISLTAAALLSTNAWADQGDREQLSRPHAGECQTPLPDRFGDHGAPAEFHSSEIWAWNERLCLGEEADMRFAPSGMGTAETCRPMALGKGQKSVPSHRQLRATFLEFVIRRMSWRSEDRRPKLIISCAVITGDVDLAWHDIAPALIFSRSRLEGQVDLQGTRLQRTLAILNSTVTGPFTASGLTSKDGLYLRDDSRFADVILRGARVDGDIILNGSTVSGKLDANRLSVGGSLALRNGGTFADVDLKGAKIFGTAAFDESQILGTFNADGLQVGQGLHFGRGGKFSETRLRGAQIGSNVNFNETSVTGPINADSLHVEGSLLMSHGSRFTDIILNGAKVGRQIALGGSVVSGNIYAQALTVEETVLLNDGGEYKSIDLTTGRIGGNLEIDGSVITERLDGSGLGVGGDLYLHDGSNLGYIKLFGANVAGDVLLSGSTFNHEVDLSGARIAGELHLSSGRFEGNPIWGEQAALVLRNAQANALQATKHSWNFLEQSHVLTTDLRGFTYNYLQGRDIRGGKSMNDESAEWLIQWIEAQPDHATKYIPQPYTELAKALAGAGETEKAKAIQYARFEHEKERSDSRIRQAFLTITGIFAGHGVYPIRALWWFLGLVGLGALFAQRSKQEVVRGSMGIWYSLENALPLVNVSGRFMNVDHGRRGLQHVFHAQKIFGLLLATVWVAALTVLGG